MRFASWRCWLWLSDSLHRIPVSRRRRLSKKTALPSTNLEISTCPSNYRRKFEFLGSWAIAADSHQRSKQIHVVYASPGTSGAYRSTGAFPDGTILVKEVYAASTDELTTGTVSHADRLNGWFVMVRDAKDAHPGNALWGDGWGWSWFDADEPAKTTTVSYRGECQACHIPARASSWIYVNGYPPLR